MLGACSQKDTPLFRREETARAKIRVYPVPGKYRITTMELWDRHTFLKHLCSALGRGILVAVVLPLVPALIFNLPLAQVLGLIGTGLLIEYGAAPVGIALGLPPLFVFFVLICTETGIFLALYDIFDTVGHTYEPVTRFLEKSRQYVHHSDMTEKYGILALIPCEILLGVYVNAPVSWVLGWREDHALLVTMAAYVLALAVTIYASFGLFQMYMPGLVPT
jgi:hypothetical protein